MSYEKFVDGKLIESDIKIWENGVLKSHTIDGVEQVNQSAQEPSEIKEPQTSCAIM